MDNDEEELRNPFPSPPSNYVRYTDDNLQLYLKLCESNPDSLHEKQADQPWSLADLEKPRVDWILEDGEYTVFGDLWKVSPIYI